MASNHREIANFIWNICNLLRGPYKRNEHKDGMTARIEENDSRKAVKTQRVRIQSFSFFASLRLGVKQLSRRIK